MRAQESQEDSCGPGPVANLSLGRLSQRFQDPGTEKRYHDWRVATALPFAQVGFIGSAPSWAAFLLAVYLLNPERFPVAAPAIASWIASLIALAALTLWPKARPVIMPLSALANSLAGFLVAWLLHEVVTDTLDASIRAGVMTGGVLIVMYFGFAIFRIPPLLAVAGITPYVLVSLSYLLGDFRAGHLSLTGAGAFTAIQIIAYSGGLLVCFTIEKVTRRTFIKDQIIEEQQRELAKSRDTIRRYVPPAVAQKIILGETSSVEKPLRRRVTILFCDIVGFTEIADRVEPEIMTQVLSDYLSAMADLVDEHGGTLNEFAGDGLMALFGAPDECAFADQGRNSVRAAMAMQARMPELNQSWRALGLECDLRVRIGINTGTVSVGSYGSSGRMTYTAVGLQTNIAARIEAAATPGSIWISDATYQLIQQEFAFEPQGEVLCRGVHDPVKVYSAIG